MGLRDLIGKARSELSGVEPVVQDVEVGGELVSFGFLPVGGAKWDELTVTHPPRKNATLDMNLGYDVSAVARAYPVDKITVDGEPVAAEDWAELFDVISSPNIKNITSVLWGINQLDPAKKLADLGKARASRSESS